MIDKTPQISGRFESEGDWSVRQFISAADLQGEPEEYVARNAHNLLCFAFHRYRFRDPELGAWVRRVGELLESDQEVERCRERFLSPDELSRVRCRAAEDF
jgi:hypothetical protein